MTGKRKFNLPEGQVPLELTYAWCARHGAEVPEGTVWPGWYPADDLEVEVLCGPWVWEPLAEQQGCRERSRI